ncbi:transposable element Tcb2 transposase [Trichonephila clavipes]|nr:transposable element Tcb2 transposase [Trichonephila clavipes]
MTSRREPNNGNKNRTKTIEDDTSSFVMNKAFDENCCKTNSRTLDGNETYPRYCACASATREDLVMYLEESGQEAGGSNRRIGRHLGRSDMVVARCWITEGRVYRRGGSGRPRNTNDREDRAIRRVATSAPTTSLASIQRHLPPSRHPVPSRETIRRRLTEVGLRSRRPLRRLPLTPHHRQCRLDFCRPQATWSVTDWRRVIFSDESRFSLSADDHRTRVWRRTGQRSDPAFIVERHTAISQGVTVWGAISWDTRSSLVVLQGTLTARRYVDDILTPIVLPMLSSRPGAIYQQDNARPHTARLSQQCLQGYDVLPWPARSPDLSPIEHVWTRWEGNCSRPEIQEN